MFGLFRKKEYPSWPVIAGNISGLIWALMHKEPKVLVNPFARVVLRSDGSVFIANDQREPNRLLGSGDASYVFFQEHPESFQSWITALKSTSDPQLQIMHTENFARVLAKTLMNSVET
jgi:hypothetical protein